MEGEVSLLMLPKVETAIVAPGNAKAILASESFQKEIQAELERIGSSIEKESVAGKAWGKQVHSEVLPNSSVLSLVVAFETRTETKSFLDLLIKRLVNRLSQLYNVESELDVRVIDGPRFETRVSSWPLLVGTSLGSGFLVTSAFFLFLSLLERIFVRQAQEKSLRESYRISPETFRPKAAVPPYWSRGEEEAPVIDAFTEPLQAAEVAPREEEVYQYGEVFADPNPADVIEMMPEEAVTAEETLVEEPEMPSEAEAIPESESTPEEASEPRYIATGPAPDNLPIFEELSPLEEANARLFKADIDETAAIQSEAAETELVQAFEVSAEPQTEEPTQEEYKRRLNELLSGRL